MTAPPRRILMVSPVDVDQLWNSSQHSRIRYYADRDASVTVVYLKLNRSERLLHMLRDSVTWRSRSRVEGNVRFLCVDPLFNYYSGYRQQTEHRARATGKGFSLRRTLVRLLSPLALLRYLFLVPCLAGSALRRLPGPFDVCLGFGPSGAAVGRILRRLGRVRLLVYEDWDYEPGLLPDRLRHSYTARLERSCVRQADVVISVSNRLAALRRRQVDRGIVVIPNGIFWEHYHAARETVRRGQTLIYVGNLVSWCGVEEAMRALPEIRRRCASARLVVVGSGLPAYEAQLHELARQLDLEPHVAFLGSRPFETLPDLFSEAEVGLASSRNVPFRRYACPLKVFEYMAAGLPVIATADTEAGDLVTRFGCGQAIRFSVEALAEASIRLLGDAEHYRICRDNAIRQSERLDWSRLIDGEVELMAAALDGHDPLASVAASAEAGSRRIPDDDHRRLPPIHGGGEKSPW